MQSDLNLTMSYLLDQHLTGLKAEGRSANTIRDRGRCLRRLHEDLPHGILYACTEQIQAWLAHDQWGRWSRYTYTGHVLAFYRWLTEQGYISEDPTRTIRRPSAPKCLPRPATDTQIAVALTAPEPLRTAVLLAMYQGMRRSEIAGARREHISEDLTIIPAAKGGNTQSVPTHPVVWEHVRDLPPGPLIVRDGTPLTAAHLSGYVLRWFRTHGLPRFGLHMLRHWYGTTIQRELGDIRVTQECLRHASISSTQVYTQVTAGQRAKAVAALPRVTEPATNRLGDPTAA